MPSLKNVLKEALKSALGMNKKVYTADKQYTLVVSEEGKFKGKVAVITGGTGAIGKATCMKLLGEGCKVYVAGRTEDKIQAIIDTIPNEIKNRGFVEKLRLDVSDAVTIEKAFEKVRTESGKIDILVNCAGGGARERALPLYQQDVSVIDEILVTNLRGSILCARSAARYMIEKKYGKIVNISSSIGINGMEKCVDYSASKSGMFGFTKSLAKEIGIHGINVNCVSPGSIKRGEFSILEAEHLKESNYLNTVGTVEDIANVIAFMVSDESKFMTGQNVVVDGGRTLGIKGNH